MKNSESLLKILSKLSVNEVYDPKIRFDWSEKLELQDKMVNIIVI